MTKAEVEKVEQESCRCVRCGMCGGSGNLRIGLDGRLNYCDDLYDLESCDECGGTGIVETCDRCQLLRELEPDEL